MAVLLALFRAADEGRLQLNDSLHVRNRFFSAAGGTVFHVSADRDATPELVSIHWTDSEDLRACARNDLREQQSGDEFAGRVSWVWNMRGRSCEKRRVTGVELRRGVEDHAAHERGINNEATADGLLSLLSAIRERFSNQRKQTTSDPNSSGATIQLDDSCRSSIPCDGGA